MVKKWGREQAPLLDPPRAPRRKALAFITERTMQNQDIKVLLDRIEAQFEQLAWLLDDSREEIAKLRRENARLKGLLAQDHGFQQSELHRIVACLHNRQFRVIEGGKACTNTGRQSDA